MLLLVWGMARRGMEQTSGDRVNSVSIAFNVAGLDYVLAARRLGLHAPVVSYACF